MSYKSQPRLSLKELRPIIEFYHLKLPTWKIFERDTLIREVGPIIQGITFERSSDGTYRPNGYVRVLVAPGDWGFELGQMLNVKVRQIDRRAHERLKERVNEAIHKEFIPNVDKPLNPRDVLELYENQVLPTSSEAYSLAPLNAYFGYTERAMYWCLRFSDIINKSGLPWQKIDYERRSFLDELEKWLKAGDARQQLERVLQEERKKWKLTELS